MALRQIKSEMEYTNKSKSLIGTKKLDWIPIILSAILLAYWWQPWIYLTATSSLLLILNFLIVGALLLWADGYEREPGITITWSVLWGCLVAISITSFFVATAAVEPTTEPLVVTATTCFSRLRLLGLAT